MDFLLLNSVLFILHLLFHVVGAAGVAIGLLHSHNVHKASWWKLAAAVLWIVVSVVVMWQSRHELLHGHSETCHEEHK